MVDIWADILYWSVFVGYLAFLAIAGIRAKEKSKTFEDFMLAGRKIGPVLLGVSFGVTYFSAVMIIGGGEFSFVWGLASIWIAVIDCLVGVFAIFVLFGNRTMRMSGELDCITVSEMLGKRYQSKGVQQYTALMTLIWETIYLVSIYTGLALLLKYAMPDIPTTISYPIAIVLCAVITIIYLNVGGAHGSIWTDAVESIIMLAGCALVFYIGITKIGGIENLITTLEQIGTAGGNKDMLTKSPPGKATMGWLGYVLVTSFGVWGMPQMISRYFTVNQKKSIRWGLVISVLWALIVSLLCWWNGAIGRALMAKGILVKPSATWTFDEIVPLMVAKLLPPLGVALFMAAVTAASLTTGEKIIMVASSSFTRDFYQLKTGCSDEKALKLTKILNIAVVVIAVALAIQPIDAVLALCMFAWAGLAAVILVPYTFGLYWKKASKEGALWTGIVACAAAVLWKALIKGFNSPAYPTKYANPILMAWAKTIQLGFWSATLADVHEFMIAQIVALIIFPIVSLLTYKKSVNKKFVDDLFDVICDRKPGFHSGDNPKEAVAAPKADESVATTKPPA